MNVYIPTTNSAARVDFATHFDADDFRALSRYYMGTPTQAQARIDAAISTAARARGISDPSPQARTDTATDFVTSQLSMMLAGPDLVRGMDDEFLFVPSRGTAVLPVTPLLPNGVRDGKYNVISHRGAAQWTNPKDTRSLPFVDTAREQKKVRGDYIGIAYQTNIVDDWENARLGINDAGEKQNVANYELDKLQEYTSSWGNPNLAIPGMFVLGDALIANMGQQFSSMAVSPTDMMLRLGYLDKLYRRANSNTQATALIAPDSDLYAMQDTYFGTGDEGPSVWDRAIRRYPWLANARWTDRLATASGDGTGHRWTLYRPEPSELFMGASGNMVFGPFQDRMTFDFIIMRKLEGVISKRPERVVYADFTP